MHHTGYFCEWRNSDASPTATVFLTLSCDSLFAVSYTADKEGVAPTFLVVIHWRKPSLVFLLL